MIDTERLTSEMLLPWVRREHEARYAFVSRYVRGSVVVDCACGSGMGTRRLLAAGARRVVALDASPEAARLARGSGAEVGIADGTALPLRDGSADVFVSLETIEHVPEDRAFLREVRRVLRPEGVFLCSTPNRAVTNPGLRPDEHPFNPFHVREYTADELGVLLSAHFRSVELLGQNPVRSRRVSAAAALRRAVPALLVARAHQATKLLYLLPPFWREHKVQPLRRGREYEYLVAVCSGVAV